MSMLKWQVNSISNFRSFFIAKKHNSPLSFNLIHFLLCINPMKVLTLRTSCALLWKFAKFLMSFSKPKVSFSSNFASQSSVLKYSFSVPSLAQTLYTLVKSSWLKCKLLILSSSRVKIHQIFYFNFETTSQFLFRFFIIL